MIRYLVSILLILSFWSSCALASEPAAAFLDDLFNQATVLQKIPNEVNRLTAFEVLFKENFDLPLIGHFILGRYWRKLDDNQKLDFAESFEKITVNRFGPMIGEASLDQLVIGRVKQDTKHVNLWNVNSKYTTPDGQMVTIVWRLVEKNGSFKIFDIVAEGVSFAITYRSEYSSAINMVGLEQFLDNLRDAADRK